MNIQELNQKLTEIKYIGKNLPEHARTPIKLTDKKPNDLEECIRQFMKKVVEHGYGESIKNRGWEKDETQKVTDIELPAFDGYDKELVEKIARRSSNSVFKRKGQINITRTILRREQIIS